MFEAIKKITINNIDICRPLPSTMTIDGEITQLRSISQKDHLWKKIELLHNKVGDFIADIDYFIKDYKCSSDKYIYSENIDFCNSEEINNLSKLLDQLQNKKNEIAPLYIATNYDIRAFQDISFSTSDIVDFSQDSPHIFSKAFNINLNLLKDFFISSSVGGVFFLSAYKAKEYYKFDPNLALVTSIAAFIASSIYQYMQNNDQPINRAIALDKMHREIEDAFIKLHYDLVDYSGAEPLC